MGSERETRVDFTIKGRFQEGEGWQANRTSRGEVEGSASGQVDAKALQEDLQILGFTPSRAKLKQKRRLRDEELAHKITGRNASR